MVDWDNFRLVGFCGCETPCRYAGLNGKCELFTDKLAEKES